MRAAPKTPKRRWVLWLATAAAIALFLYEGITKILVSEFQVAAWERWGYPPWSMFLVGAVETLGALALLRPRTAFYGAVVLLALMPGAVFTHVRNAEWVDLLLPLVATTLLLIVAWQRRPDWVQERLDRLRGRTAEG